MTQMLGIISGVFFAALFLMCYFRDKLGHTLINTLFVAIDAVLLFCWTYAGYEVGWLDGGYMTLANISPYICTVIAFCPFLSEKVRSFAYSAIAFLGFGMFLAMFISPEHEYIFNFRHEVNFVYVTEAACHLVMSLYGFYLILSNRVKLTLRNFAKSVIFMYSTVLFAVFLNWVFHKSHFGMGVYGNYSIYFLDIFNSFGATLAAYLFGILAVLCLGFAVGMGLDRISAHSAHECTVSEETAIEEKNK